MTDLQEIERADHPTGDAMAITLSGLDCFGSIFTLQAAVG